MHQLSFWVIQYQLIWIPDYYDIPGNCRANELARAGVLLTESSSIDLGMPFTSFKLARKFSRDVNLSLFNEESCSTSRLAWPSMDGRRTNQLLGFGRNFISITVAMFTGHCVMETHADPLKTRKLFPACFLCQCPSLARCRYRLFVSPTLDVNVAH